MPRNRSSTADAVLAVGTWLAGTAVAISVGFAAIGLIGDEVGDGGSTLLSKEELQRAAASLTATIEAPASESAAPRPSAAPEPIPTTTTPAPTSTGKAPTARSHRFVTRGGVVAATCTGPVITLQYAYPSDGYRTQLNATTPIISVDFLSPLDNVGVTVRCVDGAPTSDGWPEREDEREHRFTSTTVPPSR